MKRMTHISGCTSVAMYVELSCPHAALVILCGMKASFLDKLDSYFCTSKFLFSARFTLASHVTLFVSQAKYAISNSTEDTARLFFG
jgi:hypothetical protein